MDPPETEDEPCEQCGLCCRIFGPGITPTAANVYLWMEQGRADILRWFVASMEDGQCCSLHRALVRRSRECGLVRDAQSRKR